MTNFKELEMIYYFLYKTTNKLTNEYYLGAHSTSNLELDDYLGSGIRIVRSIKKYGKQNFVREIISHHASEEHLYEAERELIAQHLGKEKCLNLSEGGIGSWTYVNQVALPQLKAQGLYKRPDTSCIKNPMYGKKQTEVTKKKIGDHLREKYSTPEWRQRHREIQLSLNRLHSISEKIKRAEKIRNRTMPEERKQQLSRVLMGKPSGSKDKISVRSQQYKVNIGIPKEFQEMFISHGFTLERNKLEKVSSLGNLPFGFKNIFMKLPNTNYSKRVRSLREALALLELGMFVKDSNIQEELLKIKTQVDKQMNCSFE